MTAKRIVTACAAAIALGMLSGCATIFSGGPENVNFSSTPPGATYEYGSYSGRTPNSAQVPRNALGSSATFTLPGYETKNVPVSTGIQGATWFNLLFPPGFIVDFLSGDAYGLSDKTINAYLTPVASAAPAASAPSSPAVQTAATQGGTSCSTTQLSYPCAPCSVSCSAGKRAICTAGSANAIHSSCLTQASCSCQ